MGTARRTSRMVGLLLSISGIGVVTLPLSVLAQRSITQQIEMSIEEQPGVVPAPGAERLGGTYQRQPVFFRTTRALRYHHSEYLGAVHVLGAR